MPAFSDFTPEQLANIIAYMRSLASKTTRQTKPPGDPVQGKQVYAKSGCANCHRAGEQGSVYGPDLNRIGLSRSLEYLRESIVNPSADIPQEWEGVTVVQMDGKRVSGIRVNEDTFSVQLRDISQHFRMFQKEEVKEVIHEKKSLMPAYSSMPKAELENLLAYLFTLQWQGSGTAIVNKTEGIR